MVLDALSLVSDFSLPTSFGMRSNFYRPEPVSNSRRTGKES